MESMKTKKKDSIKDEHEPAEVAAAEEESNETEDLASPSEPAEEVAAEAMEEESDGKEPKDITDVEIQLAIAEVLLSSHYTGDQKEALVMALHEAVTGGDTVASCSVKYEVPSTTLHNYLSKLRTKLGIISSVDGTKTRSVKKRSVATDEPEEPLAPPEKKKKKYTKPANSGSSTQKPFVTPEHWLQDEAKLGEVVWSVVSKCQYAEDAKKQRLYKCIMDISTKKKSMKSSSEDQEIPLSTVQSYLRRCRAEAARILGPGEGAEQSTFAKNDSEDSNGEEDGEEKLTPGAKPRQQLPQFPVLTRETSSSNDAMAQIGAAFMSSPIVQQCLAFQALMNVNTGGPLMNLMNESLKATLGQAMQSLPNVINSSNMNISGAPAAPPPTPASAFNKMAPPQFAPEKTEPASNIFQAAAAAEPPIKMSPEDFHDPSVIFDELQLAQKFVYYFVERTENQETIQEDIKTLIKHIASAFPVFFYKIQPKKSNIATFKDFFEEKQLFYDRLLSQVPKTLAELVTDELLGFIVEYLKPFARANMVIDADFTKFLILHVLKDRSLEELYDEKEYKAMHQKILSSL